ncbi:MULTISPECIES: hypothetical protein [Desulfosediminicola]|uniref:hypothetical protein n=1 Tax=Desulfosediminicola TaxID=2886823 RepID=UPI0010AC4EF7|nr:hypothetical protein [Desulfosediminicola ganghwensis]
METASPKSQVRGFAQLIACCFVVWATTFHVLPALTQSHPDILTLADFIDESEIDTGEFYYTGVEVVVQADINTRSTIEYFAHK